MKAIVRKVITWAMQGAAQPQRSYAIARGDRLLADWVFSGMSADSEMRGAIKTARERVRDLDRNNDYVRRFHSLLLNNVLGANGIGMQSKITELVRDKAGFNRQYDRRANAAVEAGWAEWGRPGLCTVHSTLTWAEVQRLVLRSAARDGASLVRKHRRQSHPHGFTLELIEIDHLDVDYNMVLSSGSVVRMGVQYAPSGAVEGYYIFREHPGTVFPTRAASDLHEFVPASDMLHVFKPDRVGQSTGMPWCASAAVGLHMLNKYQEAEVIAARSAAAKMGFLVTQPNSGPAPSYTGPTDGSGNRYMEAEPGAIEVLPSGLDFKQWDPAHPTTAYKDFVKAVLRGISAGVGVSYTSLANDLEGVNYSSIRAGLLEEREEWKAVQGWFIESFVRPVFEEWLLLALLKGAVKDGSLVLPAAKFDKFNSPEFKPRRWAWVDPLKDLQADVLAVEKGFSSRRAIIAEQGGDIEDVFADQEADADLAEEHDLEFSDDSQAANKQPSRPDAPDDVDNPRKVNGDD